MTAVRIISDSKTLATVGAKRASKSALLITLVLYSLAQLATNYNQNPTTTTTTSLHQDHPALEGCITTNQQQSSYTRSCSSKQVISNQQMQAQAQTYLSSLLQSIFNTHTNDGRSIFGGKILIADAALLYQNRQDKAIIILNSTNFNTELIQYKHQFPHIKLIEYYLSFCGACVKFKTNYTKLAKDIYPWRNVIRPSAIDIGVASNSPIAHSWSIKEVPTLRIHPPPNNSLAEKLKQQLSVWSTTLTPSELQKSMFEQYNSSRLMIESLGVLKYLDKVTSLKLDLLNYVERYVRESPTELPATWPNLKPVTETTLNELRRNHPRHELFLIIERSVPASDSDQSSTVTHSLGLNVMMELSSSAPWKAIRYVRASENRALIEDVIFQQKRVTNDKQVDEQAELLNNLISNQTQNIGGNNIVLVHIDDSHSPIRTEGSVSAFPYITIVSGVDLVTLENSVLIEPPGSSNNNNRAKRGVVDQLQDQERRTRRSSLFKPADASQFDNMSSERKIDLLANYIKQTYTETSADREFVRAITNYDHHETKTDETTETGGMIGKTIKSQQQQLTNPKKATTPTGLDSESTAVPQQDQSVMDKFYNLINIVNPPDKKQNMVKSDYSTSTDYEDKLKAVRFMLFTEIPRLSIADKSLAEQQEKLNTLVNLVTVIKSYFPLPDSPSVQFIDGVHIYLMKQQSRITTLNSHEQVTSLGFDIRAFKQELKRLENEDKRLPEIKEWKHCTEYPCGLWRLFHTLAAFEYKKLSQIRQPMNLQPSSSSLKQPGNNLSPSVEAITMKSASSNGAPSPVERLVSPPSTTTSLSLTIATPSQASDGNNNNNMNNNNSNNNKPLTEADLPTPVILVMRDYITTFFSCPECREKFRNEAADLSIEKVRQEPADFSILWLWETHNRVNKRLSVDPKTNPQDRPKVWFPTYNQCASCYKKPPSFLKDPTIDAVTIFHESIEWNRPEVLNFLLCEYTKQPMDDHTNLFGYQVPHCYGYILVTSICFVLLVLVLRCTTSYVERQRRHKATLLNGNGTHYTLQLQ